MPGKSGNHIRVLSVPVQRACAELYSHRHHDSYSQPIRLQLGAPWTPRTARVEWRALFAASSCSAPPRTPRAAHVESMPVTSFMHTYPSTSIQKNHTTPATPQGDPARRPTKRPHKQAWPEQDSLSLVFVCARIKYPFLTPAHLHYPHYCNTITRRLRNIRIPPGPSVIRHTPYTIGSDNIVQLLQTSPKAEGPAARDYVGSVRTGAPVLNCLACACSCRPYVLNIYSRIPVAQPHEYEYSFSPVEPCNMSWIRTYSRSMHSQNRLSINRRSYYFHRSAYSTRRTLTLCLIIFSQAVETADRVLAQDPHNSEALRVHVLHLLSQEARYAAAAGRIQVIYI